MGAFTTWRELWSMSVGFDPPMTHFSSVTSAVLIYLLALLFCYVLYQLSKIFLPGFIQEYVLDFFKTLAFCTYCFGHGVVRNAHGHLGYILCMVPLNTASVLIFNLGDGTPLTVWAKYLRGQIPTWKFVIKVSAQIVAGFCAWELGHFILGLDFHPSFADKLGQKTKCNSDLRIAAIAGFFLEGTGVAYDFWVNQQTLSKNKALDIAMKFTNTALVVSKFLSPHPRIPVPSVRMTGMYIHPAMVTGRTIGCGDTPILSHLLVYWAGPFAGIFVGLKASQIFSLPFNKDKPDKAVKKEDDSLGTEEKNVKSGKVRQRKVKKDEDTS